DYARASFPALRPVLEAATELMGRIRADFTYDPEATEVSTPLEEAFRQRHGVCQDFAHVMIAGLRGLGLPAAYVSGYIRTVPPPGEKRLEGADASHAWVMLWCGPETGWIGLDPTNDLIVADDHIVTAFGRDYADVSPLDGVVIGPGSQKIGVAVDVIPIG
ncbi:MAG: transglutaminase family protein, partial [Beijerinckiaceae bacterium]|nr:transglutaminase family protein [Beijerinckiaceae bacterium]